MPGTRLSSTFMKKQHLSFKNTTKLCKARYNATKNPFIVNHWFDILEETIKKLSIEGRPDLIWNSGTLACLVNPRSAKPFHLKDKKPCKL